MSLEQETSASAVRDDSAEHEAVPEIESVQSSPQEVQAPPVAAEEAEQTAVPEVQIELPEVASPAAETAEFDSLMMADMEKVAALPTGQIIQGTVLKITDTEVFVDVGLKSEAAVQLAEFQSEAGQVTVQPGETVGVWVEGFDEKEGAVTLSRRKAARHELWERIENAFRAQTPIPGRVLERVKGGLTIFFTTHVLEEAEYLCDRIAVINQGRIVEIDTPENLKRRFGSAKEVEFKLLQGTSKEMAAPRPAGVVGPRIRTPSLAGSASRACTSRRCSWAWTASSPISPR